MPSMLTFAKLKGQTLFQIVRIKRIARIEIQEYFRNIKKGWKLNLNFLPFWILT